jgi:hypothetical protein
MKIAQALKLKNKLGKEYRQVIHQITTYNSYPTNKKNHFDVKKLMEEAQKLQNELIRLKTAIHLAAAPRRSEIFKLSELKDYLKNIKSMSTTEGLETERYNAVTIEYSVQINEIEKLKIIKQLEEKIDGIQEELDVFNIRTDVGFFSDNFSF